MTLPPRKRRTKAAAAKAKRGAVERRRPQWWPHGYDNYAEDKRGEPFSLLTIVAAIMDDIACDRDEPWVLEASRDQLIVYARALRHACEHWREPSTDFENAIFQLCDEAIPLADAEIARIEEKLHA